MLSKVHLFFAALLVIPAIAVASDRWPQFRGVEPIGVVEDPRLPDTWSATENVVWKTPIAGRGWSSPVVWGDRIFLTSVVSELEPEEAKKGLYFGGERKVPGDVHRWVVIGVEWKTGKVAWQRQVHRGVPASPRHLKNSYASETPVTDGERVYAYFGGLGIYCFDLNGKPVWSKPFEPYKMRYGWGTASSPVLYKDRLYIVNDNEEKSFILALDKKTGKEIWRAERDEASNWATPYIWESGTRTEIVTAGTRKVRSYDLDGKILWELKGMSSIAIPTPFSRFGLLYISSGYVGDQLRPVYAIRPGANGDISLRDGEAGNKSIAWFQPQAGPYNPSPIIYGDYYYTLLDRGFFTCHEAKTGKEVYGKQRIEVGAGAFTSSPWGYGGNIYCLSEDGDTFVIKAGPEFKLVRKNSLGEMCMATPAIARGSLIIRTASNLYRISRK